MKTEKDRAVELPENVMAALDRLNGDIDGYRQILTRAVELLLNGSEAMDMAEMPELVDVMKGLTDIKYRLEEFRTNEK